MLKRCWAAADIVRVEGEQRVVTVAKLTHAHRQQKLMIIPTPRIASETFYANWCYQPYIQDNQLIVSTDIMNPSFAALPRLMLNRGMYTGFKCFTPLQIPDAIENDVTRREFATKERPFRTSLFLIMFTPNFFRDAYHPWVRRRIMRLVGRKYYTHPRLEDQSYVLLLPPSNVPAALNALQDVGFEVAETVSVEVGDAATIKRLEFWGELFQFAVLSYLWIALTAMLMNEGRRLSRMYEEYQVELIEAAGRDPADFGFSKTAEGRDGVA